MRRWRRGLVAAYEQLLQDACLHHGAVALAWPAPTPPRPAPPRKVPYRRRAKRWDIRWRMHETFRAAMRQES